MSKTWVLLLNAFSLFFLPAPMLIILPLSHEKMEAQRFPYITLGIIILNTFLFLITAMVAPKTMDERMARETALVEYYQRHLYLELPHETFVKLSPMNQQMIEQIKELTLEDMFSEMNFDTEMLGDMLTDDLDSFESQESEEERWERMLQQQQQRLNELAADFERAVANDFYIKYGYIPARGGVFTIFSSMFLHGGILHLIFNMLFLWLSGCNLEDLWGRVYYPIFYLLGGVVATLAHGLMYPNSPIPLIGASGAIAALMGAFLIRLYQTKIYFVYLILLGFYFKRGRFTAPAFIMLPLWLLQQLWEAFMSGTESGVAFWAHIGGFAFGAVIAVLIKVSKFEQTFITPILDQKTAVVDTRLASGITKLQEEDVTGAIEDLKNFLRDNPNDPIAHSELSRAYFRKGDKPLALREFKRAVFLYIKRGDLEEAINEYLDMNTEVPGMMLDPPQQLKIAAAIEERAGAEREKYSDAKEAADKEKEMYVHAAQAYRYLITYYQNKVKKMDHPHVITALTQYGDINIFHLDHPEEAYKAYKFALRSTQLEEEQKQQLLAKARHAMNVISEKAKRAQQQQVEEVQKAQEAQQHATETEPAVKKPLPDIPIQKRIKLISVTDAPAKYEIGSVAPIEANKVTPLPDGIDLNRPDEPPLLFRDIYVICVAQITEITQRVKQVKGMKAGRGKFGYTKYDEKRKILVADIFVGGKSRPYRIISDRVDYLKFFPNPLQSILDNFRQFILYLIGHINSVYLDQDTLNFLKTGKVRDFGIQEDFQIYEKIFWKQLCGAVRFQCENCYMVYWIDGDKVPAAGARTQCIKCGQTIFFQPLQENV